MEDDVPQPSTAEADAAYPGFPEPDEWLALDVDMSAWDSAAAALAELRADDPDLADELRERAFREAGLDTGAIEGLYTTDRGFTMSVADAANAEEAARLVKMHKGPDVEALYRAQVEGYEMALDLVAQERPLTESWIRQLHAVITGPQDTYEVATPVGPQVHDLPKGEYKRHPNHVIQADGTLFPYAPVDETPHEMARFVELADSDALRGAHPVIAAAWLHYALVRIHPFADGNGRVTRAVASLPLLRAASVPLTLPPDRRALYLSALEGADTGDSLRLVRFVRDEMAGSFRHLLDLGRAAGRSGGATFAQAYFSSAGVPLPRYDDAADRLRRMAVERVRAELAARAVEGVGSTERNSNIGWVVPDTWRKPADQTSDATIVRAKVSRPSVDVSVPVTTFVSLRAGSGDDILLAADVGGLHSAAFSLGEIEPELSGRADHRLDLWAATVIDAALDRLATAIREAL